MNQFICAVCQKTFDKGWSDEESEAELASTFGVPKEECSLVCDTCYNKMGFGNATNN